MYVFKTYRSTISLYAIGTIYHQIEVKNFLYPKKFSSLLPVWVPKPAEISADPQIFFSRELTKILFWEKKPNRFPHIATQNWDLIKIFANFFVKISLAGQKIWSICALWVHIMSRVIHYVVVLILGFIPPKYHFCTIKTLKVIFFAGFGAQTQTTLVSAPHKCYYLQCQTGVRHFCVDWFVINANHFLQNQSNNL